MVRPWTSALAASVVLLAVLGVGRAVAQSGGERTADQKRITDAVHLSVDLAPDSLTVGDPVTATFQVRTGPDTQVRFAADQKLGVEVQVLGFQQQPNAIDEDTGATVWEATYTLAVYVVGEKMLPPFVAQVQEDSVAATVSSDSVFVFVASVLDDSLAAGDILDIKGQRDLAIPLPWWVWIVLGAVLLLVLLAILRWRARNRRAVVVPVEPPKPPHVIALRALQELEAKRLPLDGHVKEHYVQLSEILRTYLEDAPPFGIPALEETTDEIVRSLRDRGTSKERVQHVQLLCEEADLVKFAKHQPPVDDCMAGIARVADFVRETSKQRPTTPASDAAVLSALSEATHANGASKPGGSA